MKKKKKKKKRASVATKTAGKSPYGVKLWSAVWRPFLACQAPPCSPPLDEKVSNMICHIGTDVNLGGI